ncbi:toxin-activating lysine-acyltransferase [Magnetospirillum aberrantis]|uniref:RTX toxin-activating lysine-acyltransferase n=1 Tax=Magnetospirillum aberrantis SpK TaxID=908842 RepID=A0A7C9UXC4_9PROT|nr:toxin-activating lysine-acyltransferase [Magnetospirillum aberrantis SpK]
MSEQKSARSKPKGNADKPAQAGVTDGEIPRPAVPDSAQVFTTLGAVAWLMGRSPAHRHLFMADLDWLVLPPLQLGQARLYHRDNQPIAYVSWGFLSEEVEARLLAGTPRLKPTDWKSGDRPWVIETVAPFAQASALEEIVADLTKTVFGGVRPNIIVVRSRQKVHGHEPSVW